ncbi:MAG: hypothetical protein ACRDY5_06060, partial [Acidimicrobiales bacterium]
MVAEALSRTWVDRPAVAVRAELRSDHGPAGGSENGCLLAGAALRLFMARAAESQRDLSVARSRPDPERRHLADL